MANYLIEGISGTGKTTVGIELEKLGYRVIDADEVFGYFADPVTRLPTNIEKQENWFWDDKKVKEELEKDIDPTFVSGGSMNMDDFNHYFTKTFILYVDDKTLTERLLTRTNNEFGKDPEDLKKQIKVNYNGEGSIKYAKEKGAVAVDTSNSLPEVVKMIIDSLKK